MRELPTGIVTFLFSDIEGSTRLLERLGERYRDAQTSHDLILRAAIAAGGGVEVSTEGDAFFAVFAEPTGAVAAVVQVQRELAGANWPDDTALRVRMGLHTGQGVRGGGDYLGLDVNRTARIAAAAHGGEVLLSDATRVLVERHLPAGTRLEDLGQHRLKDLLTPERLHRLVIGGLEEDFPPPRTLDARPNNLPAQLTRFIGRDDDIAAISGLLASNRLVTLTGPGGTGKTRLALQVAADILTGLRDGVFFVDLSALTDSELVASEVAGALAIRTEPDRSLLATLSARLRDQEVLIVLDNFEQVLPAATSTLAPLLKAAPRITALVTSRVPLHLYGEHEYPVPPLDLPDPDRLPAPEAMLELEAIALFAERAAAGRPGFAITDANARAVAEITARLDGLPLAIELAASRIRLLSPEQILARLGRRLPLLSAQDRNVPERQRTLRRTIEWSFDLLGEAERRMFRRLAVFAGGADLEAIEAVVDPNGEIGIDTLDGLAALVDGNLIRAVELADGGRRFTMLETIREFGLERLDASDEAITVRRRHTEHWIAVGDRLAATPPPEQPAASRTLQAEIENIRAALAWILETGEADLGLRSVPALVDFWRLRGLLREGTRWFEAILDMPGAAEATPARARALTATSDLASWIRETEDYVRHAEEAVAIYRQLDADRGIADSLLELGVAQMAIGRFDEASTSLVEARGLHVAQGNAHKAAECSMAIGLLALSQGRLADALSAFEESLATFREFGDSYWMAFAERLAGGVHRGLGDLAAAETRYRASLAIAAQHEMLMLVANNLYAFADLAVERGQCERAFRLVAASEAIRESVGEAPSLEVQLVGDVRAAAASASSLDEATIERLESEGRLLRVDDAVAYALEAG